MPMDTLLTAIYKLNPDVKYIYEVDENGPIDENTEQQTRKDE